jgi:c(7)-type cytochrome triheme protein
MCRAKTRATRCTWALLLLGILNLPGVCRAGDWLPLAADGIHDPDNPALELLQEPAEALSLLPPDAVGVGNQVRWVTSLEGGYIEPRTNIHPGTEIQVLDLDIIMRRTGSAAYVRFPHRPHTEWLDCSNCHDKFFLPKAGATPITMLAILNGEYCGRCHGAVAFPLTECNRCHNLDPAASLPGAGP